MSRQGYAAVSPVTIKWKRINGELQKCPVRLLPGYVFFDAPEDEEPPWHRIHAIPHVLYALQYSDGSRVLRAQDLEFVAWFKRHEGKIDVSQVIQIGTKIHFVAGPLVEMSGYVAKVNKNRRQVAINIGDESITKLVWCSIEYVEADAREQD